MMIDRTPHLIDEYRRIYRQIGDAIIPDADDRADIYQDYRLEDIWYHITLHRPDIATDDLMIMHICDEYGHDDTPEAHLARYYAIWCIYTAA